MKKSITFLALIFTILSAAGQDHKALKQYKKERHNGSYSTYSSIIIDGKDIKNPTTEQAIRCMIQYLNNNWLESSNVYRAKHMHTSINYNSKKNELSNI